MRPHPIPPRSSRKRPATGLALLLLAGLAAALPVTPPARGLDAGITTAPRRQAAPEPSSGRTEKPLVHARRSLVVAAHPLAVDAGRSILAEGGNAVDAAIAVQLVLNLVEPQSSGIGGGAFILYRDAATGAVVSYDGRETAPMAARPERFLGSDGAPLAFDAAVASGLSVGVPGVLAALELVHREHGALPWKRLFEPAIELAEAGFPISPRLALMLAWQGRETFGDPARSTLFGPSGRALVAGDIMRNPALGATLRRIAEGGARAFYEGPIAEAIVATLAAAGPPAGDMTLADLAGYRARMRPAVCTNYRGYDVCGMGPPSSGGTTIAQVLELIEPFDLGRGLLGTRAIHLVAEAEKLAYADRDRYLADADFVAPPAGLMSAVYLAARRALIDPAHAGGKALAGNPPLTTGGLYGQDSTFEASGTTHISIVDASGNALAMTSSIETAFGSRLMVGGFLLNNQLTDFAFRPTDPAGLPLANRVEPGKRPRSSMAPTIVGGPDGRVFAVLGSPGGSRIILYVVKALVCLIDWGCDARTAAELTNFGSRNGPLETELGLSGVSIGLRAGRLGHSIDFVPMTSGLAIIRAEPGGWQGGADPRREVTAGAD